MKLIIKYLKPYLGFLSLTFIIKVIGTIIELIIPYILSHIVDVIIPKVALLSKDDSSKRILIEIIFWGLMMIVCAAAAYICNVIAKLRFPP